VSDARRSAAYRAHVIESAFPVHVVGLMLAFVAPVVSKMRNPDFMALFAETLPGVDFREVWAVVSYVLFSSTQYARDAYVTHYEIACELVNWIGMLVRCSMARYRPQMPWGAIRFVTVVASAMGARYEFRTQWIRTIAKMATACVIDARMKQKHHPEHLGKPFPELLRLELAIFAFYGVVNLGTQYVLETIDKKKFDSAWATRHGDGTRFSPGGRHGAPAPAPRRSARRRATGNTGRE